MENLTNSLSAQGQVWLWLEYGGSKRYDANHPEKSAAYQSTVPHSSDQRLGLTIEQHNCTSVILLGVKVGKVNRKHTT